MTNLIVPRRSLLLGGAAAALVPAVSIAAAPDVGALACRSGCTWCCYFSVDVRPVEVFAILDVVEQTLGDGEKARIHAEVRENSRIIKALADGERSVREIVGAVLMGSFDVCKILYQLAQSRHEQAWESL